jgi:hypothetical protein
MVIALAFGVWLTLSLFVAGAASQGAKRIGERR